MRIDRPMVKMYNDVHNWAASSMIGRLAVREHQGGVTTITEGGPKRGKRMKAVSFTEFRRRAASLFDRVEGGETVIVLRHGKPIAEVIPVAPSRLEHIPAWKRPAAGLAARPGVSLSREILKERESHRR